MQADLPAEQRTRTVRAFLKLCLASSILQSALILTIYWLNLSLRSAYLLGLVPLAPLCAAFFSAVRKRAAETDPYVRRAYVGGMVIPGLMAAMIPLFIALSFYFKGGLASAINDSAMALVLGSLFAFMLLASKPMGNGVSLGDLLLSVRVKLLTPMQNRILRTGALLFVYITVSFASRILFETYTLTPALAYAVALLPVLPIFGLIPIYNKYMAEEQDDFQRHLFQQSILIAFFCTLVVASVMGSLQDHALISRRALHPVRPYSVYHFSSWLISYLFGGSLFIIFLWFQFEVFHIASFFQFLRISAHEKREKSDQ